jgi:DedD protein
MRGAFDDEDYEQHKSGGDTEITLGAGTVLLLLGGLVLVCGLCFGFGYIVGHRGATTQSVAQQIDDTPANPQAGNTQQKPSATTQNAAPAAPQTSSQPDVAAQPASGDPSQSSAIAVPVSSAENPAPAPTEPQVRPALPVVTPAPAYPSRPANPSSQAQMRPAPALPATVLWVQIAAVSHVEDAQVLTNALRKRGYTVTPRRESDDLIHVRIGPFGSRDEANRWRLKLLDDGYNAEIQQ